MDRRGKVLWVQKETMYVKEHTVSQSHGSVSIWTEAHRFCLARFMKENIVYKLNHINLNKRMPLNPQLLR